MPKFLLGRHISIGSDFMASPTYAKTLGYQIFQIFLAVPHQVLTKARQTEVFTKLGTELAKQNVKMVVHGSYTINLCHPVQSKKFVSSVRSLVQDLNSAAYIGEHCLGVIIHMGKNIPENGISDSLALNNYVNGLKTALKQTPESTTIILETGASQGSEVASEISGLSEIYWKLDETERRRIGFCIDTCHIWATGYDISSEKGVKKFFQEFNDQIGIEKILCIHFNDSKTPLKSCVDRHADLTYGYIGESGLKAIALFAKKNAIPLITETPLDAVNPKTNHDVTLQEELHKIKSWLNLG